MLCSPLGETTALKDAGGQGDSEPFASVWTDAEAVALNKRGDIIGFGDYQGGQNGFLLTPVNGSSVSAAPFAVAPVPESSTMLTMGCVSEAYVPMT